MVEEAKKVNLTELFYDLVFVFGISKITHVLHSLERGIFSLNEIIIYIVVFVCFINVWNVQTVYMNRYGKHNLLHIIIMTVLQMPALLFMAANVSPDMEDSWTAFTLAILWIAVVQFLQYLFAYTKHKHSEKDIKLIKDFLWLLFVRSVVIVISLFIPGTGRILLTGFGFIISILGSSLFRKDMAMVPINMPHLIERLTLFTIITLGEMLMATANFFELEKFSINSVLLMFQVVALFLFYISEFDHAIEENLPYQSGSGIIYKHYFIWFGLNICTVDLEYANDVMGKWRKEDFEREKGLLGKKKAELESLKERQVAIFEKEVFELEERHKYLTALFKGKTKKWDKDFVDSIIDKIFIGKDNTIEIKFNFEETPVITEKLGRKTRRS